MLQSDQVEAQSLPAGNFMPETDPTQYLDQTTVVEKLSSITGGTTTSGSHGLGLLDTTVGDVTLSEDSTTDVPDDSKEIDVQVQNQGESDESQIEVSITLNGEELRATIDAGTFRLLVTFGEKRTKWNAPTAKELGFDIVSYSPYGIVGPKGMDPKLVKALHDAFRKTLDDPEHLKTLQLLDQVYWYKSSEDYAKWAAETFKSERATIERVGLLAK